VIGSDIDGSMSSFLCNYDKKGLRLSSSIIFLVVGVFFDAWSHRMQKALLIFITLAMTVFKLEYRIKTFKYPCADVLYNDSDCFV
jgi:hypothetical protein